MNIYDPLPILCICIIFLVCMVMRSMTNVTEYEKYFTLFDKLFVRFRFDDRGHWSTNQKPGQEKFKSNYILHLGTVTAEADNRKSLRIIFCYFSLDIAILKRTTS